MSDLRAVEFWVTGLPAPQGSKRHVGGGRMVESSKKVGPWRDAVINQAIHHDTFKLHDGPLFVAVVFHLPAPKTTRRLWPTTRPDLDKLIRSTFDALTLSGFWQDDSLVCRIDAGKTYAAAGEQLGAWISVSAL